MGRSAATLLGKLILGVLIMTVILTAAGCDDLPPVSGPGDGGEGSSSPSEPETGLPKPEAGLPKPEAGLPGELVRVLYETDDGSMEPRSAFLAEVTPEALVRAEY